MSIKTLSVSWDKNDGVSELLNEALAQQTNYLILESRPGSVAAAIPLSVGADLVVFRSVDQTRRYARLGELLPAPVYFLAIQPSDHLAVAISVKALAAYASNFSRVRSWNELMTRLAAMVTTSFADNIGAESPAENSVPGLTFADGRPSESWHRELIERVELADLTAPVDVTAFKAGLYLLNDFFDESHSQSQSIEGQGRYHTGDYWHAIVHRREPDSGNAKYWFRHVGRHPSFAALAISTGRRLIEVQGSVATKLESWKSRLISQGAWDPLAFVDLCAAAERDRDLRNWCEEAQYDEMLSLLEYTVGAGRTK